MNELITIQNVRAFIDNNGIAQLNLEDVARGLGFTQIKDGKEYIRWETVIGYLESLWYKYPLSQQVGKDDFIPENIFYRLAMKASNKTAEIFQAKVADEILPSIRKHGMYARDELLDNPDLLIEVATRYKEERQLRLAAETKIKELTPAAEFGMTVGSSKGGILVRDFVKLLANDGIKIGQDQFFSWLHLHGYIYRTKEYKHQWLPYVQFVNEQGLFKVREIPISTNENGDQIKFTVKITGKGQKYFYEKLKSV